MSEKKIDIKTMLARLDEIVGSLENDSLSLDESLKLYTEGKKIVKELSETLENAKETVEQVIIND